MYSFFILLTLFLIAVIFGIVEYILHQKRIKSIPVRIHINGTRGKSSVTRLIGAGLKAGGISNITKVTGTFPRLILEDGTETYIHRKGPANIIEQLSIVKYAASRKVKALVMECMALQPQYQTITDRHMIHSNICVMTNIRIDHTDVMGHTIEEIAQTLGRTIPANEHLFSSEDIVPGLLESMAAKRHTVCHFIDPQTVTMEEMNGFSYIEHRENVSLALAVCQHLNIDRETALQGMYKAVPDAGALMVFRVKAFQKQVILYNAFAANDPDSTFLVWKKIRDEIGMEGARMVLLNTRQDRLYRAQQLTEMLAARLDHEIDYLILIGQSIDLIENMALNYGIHRKKLVCLGWKTPERVFDKVFSITDKISTLVAIGNMGGIGADTIEYFKQKTLIND